MKNYPQDNQNTEANMRVAYFCAEYALSPTLPIYAGGLGVLSGDYVREVGAQNFPLTPIGILYKNAQSMLKPSTNLVEDTLSSGLAPVFNKNNEKIIISIPIGEREVKAVAYLWSHENASVYLLDTDIEENDPEDRKITNDLYVDDRQERLRQEILLGIGGFELLKALEIKADVYHLNEGHSAFLSLALIKEKMDNGRIDLQSAKELAKKEIFFTNHTLILEGQEMFTRELIEKELRQYVNKIGINISDVWKMGATKDDKMFSMTSLAFHMSSASNAVSKIHSEKAQILWPDDHPTEYVTNGIYLPRWNKIGDSPTSDFGVAKQENKRKLLDYIKKETGEEWSEDVLIFGWARRFVEYKQPLLILSEVERIKKMMKEKDREFRIVFSGPTGADPDSNPLISKLHKIIEESLKGLVVFLPHYNTAVSEIMTAGCDVWLNTPVIGREACGTSGMKAALNGALPLSTRDGWIAEVDISNCGWVIDEPDVNQKLLEIIENEIVPLYYENKNAWIGRMQNCRTLIQENFSTKRMLDDYINKLYHPMNKK